MPFNAKQVADDTLNAAYNSGGSLEATFYVDDWPDGMVKAMVDALLEGLEARKLRLRGIRTDAGAFAQFGIKYDLPDNSGRYRDIPVVRGNVAFGSMQVVIEPRRS